MYGHKNKKLIKFYYSFIFQQILSIQITKINTYCRIRASRFNGIKPDTAILVLHDKCNILVTAGKKIETYNYLFIHM